MKSAEYYLAQQQLGCLGEGTLGEKTSGWINEGDSCSEFSSSSVVALKVNKHDKFDLMLEGDCDVQGLRIFVGEKALAVKEDEEKGLLCYLLTVILMHC